MKRLIFTVLSLCVLAACSDRMDVGHDVESTVYLMNHGESNISLNSLDTELKVWVYKSGYDSKTYSVKVIIDEEDIIRLSAKNKTSYTMLPPNSFELATPSVSVGPGTTKAAAIISLDSSCIPEGKKFLLPIRIACEALPELDEDSSIAFLFITKH